MTLPAPDAHPTRSMPDHPHSQISPAHSIPPSPSTTSSMSSPQLGHDKTNSGAHEHAVNFATHSWDLATGGLKTLTAKRELPLRTARPTGVVPDIVATSRSYVFAIVIMICVVLMLIGGGIVLFVMLHP